jgi:cell division protein FtsB
MRGFWPIPALVAAALLFAWIDGDAGLRTWWELRGEVAEAQVRNEGLRRDVEVRQRDATALEDDDFAIERAIRERLEYARPGETIVKLRDSSGATRWSD